MDTAEEITSLRIKILDLEEKIRKLQNDIELIKLHYPDPWDSGKAIGSTSDKRN